MLEESFSMDMSPVSGAHDGDTATGGKSQPPNDKFHLTRVILFLLGLGGLISWNAWISAFDYFAQYYGTRAEFWFSLGYQVPNFIALLMLLRWLLPVSPVRRLYWAFGANLVAMLAVITLDRVFEPDLHKPTQVSFFYTFASVILTGLGSSIAIGSCFGVAGQFPQQFTGAAMSGQGIAGVVIAALRVFSKVGFSDDQDGLTKSVTLFFSIACVLVILCIIGTAVLPRVPFARYYLTLQQPAEIELSSRGLLQDGESSPDPTMSTSPATTPPAVPYRRIFQQIRGPALGVFITFTVTLSVFPGLVVQIPTSSSSMSESWFRLILICLFMVADLCGRSLPAWKFGFTPTSVWKIAAVRLIFIPLFLFCVKPRFFAADWCAYVIMICFAASNGLVATGCMILAPPLVADDHKEACGTMMTVFISGGLAMGSVIGTAFALIKPD